MQGTLRLEIKPITAPNWGVRKEKGRPNTSQGEYTYAYSSQGADEFPGKGRQRKEQEGKGEEKGEKKERRRCVMRTRHPIHRGCTIEEMMHVLHFAYILCWRG